ncbi:MAG: sugar transferase [Calothrix sp. MO_167.B12]|nr:sugar transferase [Calothrix sp. MO_167.B12]
MNTSIIDNFQTTSHAVKQDINEGYVLIWRRNQLLVKSTESLNYTYLYRLDLQPSLADCLKHSPVNLVRIDTGLGEEKLKLWADACQEANKPIYLRIPHINRSNTIISLFGQWLQQSTNWLLALILFMGLMPFILALTLWMQFYCQNSLFTYEWRVGKRGKLFRLMKFCITNNNYGVSDDIVISTDKGMCINRKQKNIIIIAKLMHKYGIDKLPQLLNVLRGEMMLVGSNCWSLTDVVNLSDAEQKQLNQMPGIINLYQIDWHSKVLNIDSQTL